VVNSIGEEAYVNDKTWLEFSVKGIVFRLIKWIIKNTYKIYIFIIIFIYLCIILILLF